MENKILIAAPVYDGMDYIIDEFIEAVKNIEGKFDFVLADNSDSDNFSKRLKEKGINVLRIISQEPNIQKIVQSRNKIREHALEKGYDYLLMMDADVIPPKNILKDLIEENKDIISGVYFNYFKIDGEFKQRPVAWKGLSEEEFNKIRSRIRLPDMVKTKEDLRRHLTKEEWESREVLEVIICSAGCMLLKRKVFEEIKYGLMDIPSNLHTSDDIYFFNEARKKGFRIYCHTGIKCEHKIEGKFTKEGNSLIHPAYD